MRKLEIEFGKTVVQEDDLTNSLVRQQKSVCVSGATGFLGNAIVLKLFEQGYSVLALSRQPVMNHSLKAKSTINYVSGTIEDWERAIRRFRPDVMISCDWEGVSQDLRDCPEQNLNTERVARLGQLAVEIKVKVFLTFGSQAEIAPSTNLIDESPQVYAQNSYGSAKSKLRKALNLVAANSVTKIIWARIFTIYGPGDTRKSLVTEAIRKAISGDELIIEHPNQKWSFLYIDDFTNAVLKLLEKEDASGVINIGNSNATELRLVNEEIFKSLDIELSDKIVAQEANLDSMLTWIPKTETLSSLGWHPETSFHEGISKTVTWWRLKD